VKTPCSARAIAASYSLQQASACGLDPGGECAAPRDRNHREAHAGRSVRRPRPAYCGPVPSLDGGVHEGIVWIITSRSFVAVIADGGWLVPKEGEAGWKVAHHDLELLIILKIVGREWVVDHSLLIPIVGLVV